MIYKAFRDIISSFIGALTKLVKGYTFGAEEYLYRAVDAECQKMIKAIADTAPDIINRELKGLVTSMPLKYNKQVIDAIYTDISIFKGSGVVGYSKYDIDKMKKVILQGKYNKLSTSQIQDQLVQALDVPKRRALLIARAESQNLDSSVKDIYFKEFSDKYRKVWSAHDDARPEHAALDGAIADDDGLFSTQWGKIPGPEGIPQASRWNCRCKILLVHKENK